MACGALHSLILTNKNRLFSCGFGDGYALGHEDNQSTPEFKVINAFQRARSPRQISKCETISCGLSQSGCIIEGNAYIWGILGQRDNLIFKQPTLMSIYLDQY